MKIAPLLRHGKNYVQPSSVQFDGRNLGDVLGPHGPSRVLIGVISGGDPRQV